MRMNQPYISRRETMNKAQLCDTCNMNDAFYYTGGVYTCAPCALEEIRDQLPPDKRHLPLPNFSRRRGSA